MSQVYLNAKWQIFYPYDNFHVRHRLESLVGTVLTDTSTLIANTLSQDVTFDSHSSLRLLLCTLILIGFNRFRLSFKSLSSSPHSQGPSKETWAVDRSEWAAGNNENNQSDEEPCPMVLSPIEALEALERYFAANRSSSGSGTALDIEFYEEKVRRVYRLDSRSKFYGI